MLVVGDSLTFHGPERGELLTDRRLYPQVIARELDATVAVVARLGWTSRDAWDALTKDPNVYSVLLPRAAAVVLAVGGADHLPVSLPTWVSESLRFVRPDPVRRAIRAVTRRAHGPVVRLTRARWRAVPQHVTDAYLTRCVEGIRFFRPGLPIVVLAPPPYDSPYHGGVTRLHRPAVAAARRWADRLGVRLVDVDPIVAPRLAAGRLNPDGMHWPWDVHEEVGTAIAAEIRRAWMSAGPIG